MIVIKKSFKKQSFQKQVERLKQNIVIGYQTSNWIIGIVKHLILLQYISNKILDKLYDQNTILIPAIISALMVLAFDVDQLILDGNYGATFLFFLLHDGKLYLLAIYLVSFSKFQEIHYYHPFFFILYSNQSYVMLFMYSFQLYQLEILIPIQYGFLDLSFYSLLLVVY
ncbi:unnamed protein product [Paramecium sonneborni]|uniref:Transmembrane protein n=1 Tax=Paramecium sonneborni TaxID=65129 RepID=A0A8S1P056_9CILI|nr:unnamed protein product [Paramecium sonneborni]